MNTTTELVRVKTTHLKGLGYGIRIWVKDHLWSDRIVKSRAEVGPSIYSDLRMINKCGVSSPMASASRARHYA